MLHHIVMWRFKPNADGQTKEENLLRLKEKIESLKEKISEIEEYHFNINITDSERASDAILISGFKDKDALSKYNNHPEHQKVVGFIREITIESRVVDYID